MDNNSKAITIESVLEQHVSKEQVNTLEGNLWSNILDAMIHYSNITREVEREAFLKSMQMSWVPVDNQLPEPTADRYWARHKDGKIYILAQDDLSAEEVRNYYLENITHYMPINRPEPPLY